MRTPWAIRLLSAILISVSAATNVFACQCGGSTHGKNAWENAKDASQRSLFIFEGTPVRFELKWRLLFAKDGELIPADFLASKHPGSDDPGMVVTFGVQRVYKGNLGSEVQLHTGMGGGDCGARYAPSLNYLVYAYGSSPDELGVSMCSPGGWIGSNKVATDMRYLRKERPISADLVPILHWSDPGADKQREMNMHAAEEDGKRYAAATGRICGTLIRNANDDSGGTVAFLSTLGYSAAEFPEAPVKENGSFCSPNLGPGKYYLYFVRRWRSPAMALYYPGVTDVAKATAIEVIAAQTVSNITFKIEERSSHSVRGFISADQKLDFRSNVLSDVMVLLIRTEGGRAVWYSEKATFLLPKLGYFAFDDVVPGHYAACVLGPGPGWLTRKVDVYVTTHMKLISLDLVHEKKPK